MLVNPKLDFHSVADLITYAKRYPGKLTFGSAGNGTSNHLAGELLKKMADVELTHVPYKGNAAAMTDVIGGTISFMFDLPSTSLPHAKADRVKLLATTGSGRSPLAPEVPTVSESGIKNFYVTSWFGVFAPAKTDDAIVVKLSQTIVGILKDPVITQLMAAQGYEVFGSTPQKLQEMLNQEITLWGELIRSAGIKLE
jgi:tripartite-type tricarboxylate transporter receptor subunit TctC